MITVRLTQNAAEAEMAQQFVVVQYRQRRYFGEVDTLGNLAGRQTRTLVAMQDGAIVGSLSFVPGSDIENFCFPTEEIFDFSLVDTLGTARSLAMETGRLACSFPDRQTQVLVTKALFYGAVRWGDRRGISLIVASMRLAMQRQLRLMGIPSQRLPGIVPVNFDPKYRRFFTTALAALMPFSEIGPPIRQFRHDFDDHIRVVI